MQTVGAFHAKTHFSALLEQVEKGDQIIITKHGYPVAKLVPTEAVDHERVKQAIEKLKKFGKQNTLGGIGWKALRDEGRR